MKQQRPWMPYSHFDSLFLVLHFPYSHVALSHIPHQSLPAKKAVAPLRYPMQGCKLTESEERFFSEQQVSSLHFVHFSISKLRRVGQIGK